MADKTITALTAGSTPDGTELMEGEQGGNSRKFTSLQISKVAIVGRQSIWIPAGAFVANTTSGPATGSLETTTNKVMLPSLDFDASAIESAQALIAMPKQWDLGTVSYKVFWRHPSTTTNFKVAWDLAGVALSDGDAGDAAFGTVQQVNDTGGTTNTIYVSPEPGTAVTIAGTPAAEDLVALRIRRVATDATNDTLAVDAALLGVMLYITTTTGNDA